VTWRHLTRMLPPGAELEVVVEERVAYDVEHPRGGRPMRNVRRQHQAALTVLTAEGRGHAMTTDLSRDGMVSALRLAQCAVLPAPGHRARTSGTQGAGVATFADCREWTVEDVDAQAARLGECLDERLGGGAAPHWLTRARAIRSTCHSYASASRASAGPATAGTGRAGEERTEERTQAWVQARITGRHAFGVSLGDFARHPDGLSVTAIADEAATRIPTGEPWHGDAPVRHLVWQPEATAALLAVLGTALLGDRYQAGRSFLAGRRNKLIGAGTLSIVDDGRLAAGPMSRVYDAEGVPTRRTVLVDRGTLVAVLHDEASAGRDGATSTGNSVQEHIGRPRLLAPTNLLLVPAGEAPPPRAHLRIEDLRDVATGADVARGLLHAGFTGVWCPDGTARHPVTGSLSIRLDRLLHDIEAVVGPPRFLLGRAGFAALTLHTRHTDAVRVRWA